MNLLRGLFYWIFLPLLGLMILVIVIFNLLPQAEMRDYAARQLSKKLDRQVEMGVLTLGLRGLSIDRLKISEVPTFQFGTLFEAKGIRLGWELQSLWDGLDLRKRAMTKSSGHFHIDDFRNPHYVAKDFSLRWSLSGIDASYKHLTGWAKLEQGQGTLENVDSLMARSPAARVALAPVLAIMNIEKLGILRLGIPDLRHWPIHDIKGDYDFKNGRMRIKQFVIDSPQLGLETTGQIDLPTGRLQLSAELKSPKNNRIGAFDAKLGVGGTLSNPKVDLRNLTQKAFTATVGNLLQTPNNVRKDADDVLKSLFKK